MLSTIVNFINAHDEQIDNGEWLDLFYSAWNRFDDTLVDQLLGVLYEVEDKDTLQLAATSAYIKWRIEYELSSPFNDRASSWSRLNWMLYGMPYFDQSYEDIKAAVFKDKDWIGATLEPLDMEYSWDGGQDYDLGYFTAKYYNPEGN